MEQLKHTKEKLQLVIEDIKEDILKLSERIHKNPEIAFKEVAAAKCLSDYLEYSGFRVERGIAGLKTAFHAVLKGGDGPTVAFLCEYDALPEVGHGCGHNLIGSASVGAAAGLAKIMGELAGTVVVLGTPAEEGGGGKITILEHGFFKGVDAVLMFHPSNETVIHRGALGRSLLNVEFLGRSAHASSSPTKGINALDAMISFFVSIGLLRQQISDDARIHGVITNGGSAPNVIPDHTEALFSIRSANKKDNKQLVERVMNCARGAATATGTEARFNLNPLAYEPKIRNVTLDTLFMANIETFNIGEVQLQKDPTKGGIGSTDIGNVSQVVPVLNPYIRIGEAPTHSTGFVKAAASEFAAERMIVAAKSMAMTAIDLFVSPGLIEQIWNEFNNALSDD